MKKLLMAALIGLLLVPSLVLANDVRVIPYPDGVDIKSEGASAAPKEITHKASPYFNMPDVFELTSNDHLTILSHYPTYQQTTEYSCGPAAALTILWHYGKNNVTEKELIEKMGSSFETGTTVKGIANYFNSLGWNVKTNLEGKSFDEYEEFSDFVLKELKLGHPIMMENVFIFPQANRLADEIYNKYGDKPEFPWPEYPTFGVFKNPNNGKWYALVMALNVQKLDKKLTGEVEVMNIKLDPEKIKELHKEKGFYPAYHMNKKNWISILLNDTVPDKVLLTLLDESLAFTIKKHN